ncbi:hypothetical protein L484_008988 [Morus notabilis]|uniref:Disease resistance protein At4g27190-like leucine-rich repeats domain-containing protein n=1 Tax=Morus notabilis TaxID=981085 RepID=W9R3E1_9ROSA|nr:hypothetical protein L484_008988 [Morus notabilis]
MKMTLELEWAVEGDSERSNACLAELKNLAQLKTLRLDIPYAHILPKDVFSDKLEIYEISIGCNGLPYILLDFRYEKVYSLMLKLKFKERSRLLEDHCLLRLMNRSEVLFLDELEGLEDNVVPDFNTNGFPQLKHLNFENNGTIKYIVDMTRHIPSRSVFQRLESLTLESMKKLEKICHGKLTTETFHKLQVIKVSRCHNLKDLFSLSTAMCLSQLQTIEVSCCKMIEEVVLDDLQGANNEIFFPQFFSLRLFQAPKLSYFYSSLKASTSTLPLINKKLLPSPNLRNLKEVCVQDCGSLKYLFSSSVDANFEQLNRLEIRDCETMEEIISVDQRMSKLLFPNLRSLCLSQLPKVTRFSTGTYIELPLLNELEIYKCPELATFLYTSTSTKMSTDTELRGKSKLNLCTGAKLALFGDKVAFPSLESIRIKRLDCLKSIWHGQPIADSFCKLELVEVWYCDSLLKVFPSNYMLRRFHNLRRFYIRPWKSLDEENSHPREVFQNLEDLLVWRRDSLKNVVPSSVSFPNLTSLSVSRCHGMINLFSFSVARSLERLQKISIDECQMMTEIVSNDGGPAGAESLEIIFNQLEVMELYRLPSLSSFYSGISSMRFPRLRKVVVVECPNMQNFCCMASMSLVGELPLMQPLESSHSCIAFHGLEILFVRRCDSLTNLIPFSMCFQNVTILRIAACNGMVSLLSCSTARYLSRLQTLSIIKCQRMQEVISSEWCDSDTGEIVFEQLETLALHKLPRLSSFHSGKFTVRFPKLKTVVVMQCPEVKSLRNVASPTIGDEIPLTHSFENFHLCEVFQKLETLDVGMCAKLMILAPPSISFSNLTRLRVSICSGMVYLLSFSTARSLARLKSMSISECQMMTQVIANEGDDLDGACEITFKQLEMLELHSLPSLTSFHLGDCVMGFPKLKRLIVTQCPELKSFSCGAIVPKLDKIITRINDRYIRAQNFWNIKGYFEDLEQARPIQELWKDDFHSSMQELWEINLGIAIQQLFREEDPKLEDPGEDPDNDFEEEEGFDNFSVF